MTLLVGQLRLRKIFSQFQSRHLPQCGTYPFGVLRKYQWLQTLSHIAHMKQLRGLTRLVLMLSVLVVNVERPKAKTNNLT